MESLNEIKKTFLQFVDILEEGLVSQSEFENTKRKLRVFADTETPLRENRNTFKKSLRRKCSKVIFITIKICSASYIICCCRIGTF